MTGRRILIVGGSTRAAADSVRRAGWQPVCADLFADFDLRKTAQVIPVRNYPRSLIDDLRDVQADGWFYCGAMENDPELIARLSSRSHTLGELLGTSADALQRVRDPFWLADLLRSNTVPAIQVRRQGEPPAADGQWLQKPLSGAGGRQIRVWDLRAFATPMLEPHYFQSYLAGTDMSCLYRVDGDTIEWLGATREIDSRELSRQPTRFTYCGSIGPLKRIPPDDLRNQLFDGDDCLSATMFAKADRIVELIARSASGLRGLVGLDFRLAHGELWLLEVNPRYTASVEILELASGRSLLDRSARSPRRVHQPSPPLIAKQIIYATNTINAPDLSRFWSGVDPWRIPAVADIPVAGTFVEAGWPICSVISTGSTSEQVTTGLAERISLVRHSIGDDERTTMNVESGP